MSSHRIRLIFIGILTLVALIGVIIFAALGQTEGTAFGIVVGILSTGVAALADASAVEARRRNPNVSAIVDDVRGEGLWKDGKLLRDDEIDASEAETKPGV